MANANASSQSDSSPLKLFIWEGTWQSWTVEIDRAALSPQDNLKNQVGKYFAARRHGWMSKVGLILNVGDIEIQEEKEDSVTVKARLETTRTPKPGDKLEVEIKKLRTSGEVMARHHLDHTIRVLVEGIEEEERQSLWAGRQILVEVVEVMKLEGTLTMAVKAKFLRPAGIVWGQGEKPEDENEGSEEEPEEVVEPQQKRPKGSRRQETGRRVAPPGWVVTRSGPGAARPDKVKAVKLFLLGESRPIRFDTMDLAWDWSLQNPGYGKRLNEAAKRKAEEMEELAMMEVEQFQ